MTLYNEENTITYQNNKYEKLFDHPEDEKYRVILDDDDYDYVEDKMLINILDLLFTAK